jgi:hypothetical protein
VAASRVNKDDPTGSFEQLSVRDQHEDCEVYSSRVMLRQVPHSLCPPESEDKFVREQFCGYFDKTMREKQLIDERARNFLSETFRMFDSAGKPPHSKGDHIFVNPIDTRSV